MFAELYSKFFPKKKAIDGNVREKTRHEAMRDCLAYSKKMLGKRFSVKTAQVVTLTTISSNIILFNQELTRLNQILNGSGVLKATDAIYDQVELTLEQFFIDQETHSYISQTEYRKFHELATEFTQLTLEGSTAEYGPQEHNYRALSKVIRSIIQICQAIDKASQ